MYTWQEFGITLPDPLPKKETFYCACPDCNVGKNTPTLKVYYTNNSWFCAKCGYAGDLENGVTQDKTSISTGNTRFHESLNTENSVGLNNSEVAALSAYKISKSTYDHFNVSLATEYFSHTDKFSKVLKFPHVKDKETVSVSFFNANNALKNDFPCVAENTCFNHDAISLEHTYIVLDPMEALSLHEAGITNVISFFGGLNSAEKYEDKHNSLWFDFFSSSERKLTSIKKITLAFPNTEFAQGLQDECIRRFGKEKCWIVHPPEKDYTWNNILADYGKKKLAVLLQTAKAIPVRGIFNLSDIEDRIDNLYDNGLRGGYSTGYPTLDDYYKVVPGQWTIVTGIPGHGKSNLLDSIMVNLAKISDWNFAIFSPENQPIERHFAGIIEKYHKKAFDKNKKDRMTREEMEEGKRWVDKHFSVLLPHEDDDWHIQGVLSLAKTTVFRTGVKGLVIDPWNELDHSRPAGQTETEYISSVLTEIRKFARQYDVHVWVVAHPAKMYKNQDGEYPVPTPYDIAGSAHFRNKADNAITAWRHVGFDDQDIVDVHIQKVRFKEVGQVGVVSLRFDIARNSLMDDIDQFKRADALDKKVVLKSMDCRIQIPRNII